VEQNASAMQITCLAPGRAVYVAREDVTDQSWSTREIVSLRGNLRVADYLRVRNQRERQRKVQIRETSQKAGMCILVLAVESSGDIRHITCGWGRACVGSTQGKILSLNARYIYDLYECVSKPKFEHK
jgi:hypothetical protein